MIKINVPKIRSYQTLVYKNGNRTFRKQAYKDYKAIIEPQLSGLQPILGAYSLTVAFYSRTKTIGDLDNIVKPISDILEDIGIVENDKLCHELIARKFLDRSLENDEIEIHLSEIKY